MDFILADNSSVCLCAYENDDSKPAGGHYGTAGNFVKKNQKGYIYHNWQPRNKDARLLRLDTIRWRLWTVWHKSVIKAAKGVSHLQVWIIKVIKMQLQKTKLIHVAVYAGRNTLMTLPWRGILSTAWGDVLRVWSQDNNLQ